MGYPTTPYYVPAGRCDQGRANTFNREAQRLVPSARPLNGRVRSDVGSLKRASSYARNPRNSRGTGRAGRPGGTSTTGGTNRVRSGHGAGGYGGRAIRPRVA